MIGLSPPPTVHPSFLQQTPVRASTKSYLRFTLSMGRSPGFGSTDCNLIALFRLGFPSAPALKALTSLQPVTRRLINQKAYRHDHCWPLRLLVSIWFQVLFHSLRQGSFRLSLTVLVHYRSSGAYLALEGGPPGFPQDSTCPVVLRIPLPLLTHSAYGTITPYGRPFHAASAISEK